MPLPIPISLGDELAPYRDEALAACTEAALPRSCVEAVEEQAVARILTARQPHAYRVEVWREGRWLSRELVFAEVDAPRERARALGLTAGVLAVHAAPEKLPDVEMRQEVPPKSSGPEESSQLASRDKLAEQAPQAEAAPERPSSLAFRAELAARAGPGIDGLRAGGAVSAALLVRRAGIGPYVTAGWLGSRASDAGASAQWASIGAGLVAVVAPSDAWSIDAKMGYVREHWRVVAPALGPLEEESARRTYGGFTLELGGAARVVGPLFVRVGAGLSTSPAQNVRVAGRDLGENPSPAPLVYLGLALNL